MNRVVIGTYPICNTASLNIYEIDCANDRVLAGINNNRPYWHKIRVVYSLNTGVTDFGFNFGGDFISFSSVLRI
jgi:hypothetical protein